MGAFAGLRVLVVGGAGFLGAHLARRLMAEKADVHILARSSTSLWRLQDVEAELTVVRGDVTCLAETRGIVEQVRPQIVFNTAGKIRAEGPGSDVNLAGVESLCTALIESQLPLRAVVQTGTCEEYGAAPAPFVETQREEPLSVYGRGKAAATQHCLMRHRSAGLPVTVLRPTLIYGPLQDGGALIPSLIHACLRGEARFPMTSGLQIREPCYVDDVVEAHLLAALSAQARGKVFNIGGGTEWSVRALASQVTALMNNTIILDFSSLADRSSEVERLCCRMDRARQVLDWSPRVGFDEGLRRTADAERRRIGSLPR